MFLVTLALSCNKTDVPETDNKITIETGKRYILFDAGISTKGSLITRQYLNADFAVLGYEYPSAWDISGEHAEPSVFDNIPQKVEYNDSSKIYTYDPLKIWSGNMYSFFGYYPCDNDEYIQLFDGNGIKEGIPYITYTLPRTGNPRDFVDLMTGSFMNTRIDYTPEVSMAMRHRLSAIDIAVRNYYVYSEEEQPQEVTIEVTQLKFIPIVANTKVKVYLDGTTKTIAAEGNESDVELNYPIVDPSAGELDWNHRTFIIEPNSSDNPYTMITSDEEHVDSSVKDDKKATSIILIPQDNALKYNLVMEYKLKYDEDSYITAKDPYYPSDSTIHRYSTASDKTPYLYFENSLVEGRRYNVEITFTASAVSVNITTSDQWDDKDDVKLEFE